MLRERRERPDEDQARSTTEHGRSPRRAELAAELDLAQEAALLAWQTTKLLDPLDEREREILRLRFGLDRGEPRTLEQVGQHLHLSLERIRQIEAEAMSKLRHPSVNCGVREFLTD